MRRRGEETLLLLRRRDQSPGADGEAKEREIAAKRDVKEHGLN